MFEQLTPTQIAASNKTGCSVVCYGGYAVDVPVEQIDEGVALLSEMSGGARKFAVKSIKKNLDSFVKKYPLGAGVTIPEGELSDFKADVVLFTCEHKRRGDLEDHKMPEWMLQGH